MKYRLNTDKQPRLYQVTVTSARPQEIMLAVSDSSKPNTYYSKHIFNLHGTEVFDISLPITPKDAFFEISTTADLNSEKAMPWMVPALDSSLKFGFKELPFVKKSYCLPEYANNKLLREFLQFTGWFSENASVLPSGESVPQYISPNGMFKFKYLDDIIDDMEALNIGGQIYKNPNFGKPSPTSYRVHTKTKDMELAKNYVIDYSIPQRMVLFAHEFGHGYLNHNPADEFEADYHAINICRGCLGFGKRELGTAFAKVFMRYRSDENRQRIAAIKKQLEQMP